MERTEEGFEHLTFGRRLLRELHRGAIVISDLRVREQEVLDIVRRLLLDIAISGVGLLDCSLHIQSGSNAIAFLSWPTERGKVDNAIKTILLATMAGLVLRLRMRRGLYIRVRQRTSNPPCSATKTYQS